MIEWFKQHRWANLVFLFVYVALVILPHEWVGLKINGIFKSMGRQKYDQLILIGSVILLSLIIIAIAKKLISHAHRSLLIFFFALTILFIYLVNSYLFVVNIESVHYVQYAVAAMIIFPLFNSYYATLFWATLMGVVDESYQYFILAPERTDYFDINDVITNFLGVAFGLLLLKTLGIKADRKDVHVLKKWVLIPTIILVAFVGILLATSVLSVGPSDDTYNLVRVAPPGFWSTVHPNVTYHVVKPLEGVIYMLLLFGIYSIPFRSETKLEEMN